MGSGFNEKRLQYIEALEERMQFYKEKSLDKLYKETEICYLDGLITFYIHSKQSNIQDSKKIEKLLSSKFKLSYKKMKNNELIDKVRRRKYIIFNFSDKLFYLLLKGKLKD